MCRSGGRAFQAEEIASAKALGWIRNVGQKCGPGDFPDRVVVENPPANAGDTGSFPGLGRSHKPRSN